MFRWLTDLFKDNRCKCPSCEVTRYGWGYAPCENLKRQPSHQPTKQPPRKP